MFWTKSRLHNRIPWRSNLKLYMVRPLQDSYLPRVKSHVQFPYLTSFQRISPRPKLCEMSSIAVSCYDVELLATHPRNKLEDTPYRMTATAYSVYYQLLSISGDLLHRNLRVGPTTMTRKHVVRLMIHSDYDDNFYHRLVFLVTLTVLLKEFTPQPYLTSIINALLSMSIIDLLPILEFIIEFFFDILSLIDSSLTYSHDEINYITPKTGRESTDNCRNDRNNDFLVSYQTSQLGTSWRNPAQSVYWGGAGLDDPRVRIPVKASVFCPLQNFQTGSGAHKTSSLVCTYRFHRG
jgi:hypothetical protein